jgi:hypothetical protein
MIYGALRCGIDILGTGWAAEQTSCQWAKKMLGYDQRFSYRRPTFSLPAGVGFLYREF